MRSSKTLPALLVAAAALSPSAGCGHDDGGETDIAKLEPPPQAAGAGKAPSRPLPPPPRFGSPPKKASQP